LVVSNAVAKAGTILSNYNISYIAGNLVINAAPITVTADGQTMAYGASSLPNFTYVATGLKNGDTPFTGGLATTASVFNGNAGTASGIGAYGINQGTLNAGTNYMINFVSANLTVNPVSLVISANAQSSTYGSALNLGTSAFSASGLVNGDTVSSVGLTVAANVTVPGTTNAGTYTIVSNNALGTRIGNYNITYQTGVLTVNPKPINVVANPAAMVYADASLPALTYQTITGLVNGDTMSGVLTTSATAFNGSAGSASNVGTYAITQGSLTAGNNYAITYAAANLTVSVANLTVAANNQTSTYGALSVIAQTELTSTGLRNGDYVSSANIQYNGNQVIPGAINAGTYASAISISNAAGTGVNNYNITYAPGNLTVNKAALVVTAVADGKFISQTDLAGSATNCGGVACAGGYSGAMYSGFVNGDSVAGGALGSAALVITRLNDTMNTAGLYTGVLVPGGLNPQNYSVQYVAGNYVIAPAEQLLVKMGNNTSTYGTAPIYGSVTAAYLKSDGTIISGVPVSVSGSTISMNDGLGSTAQFTASPINPVNSSSVNLSVGSYALGASSPSISGTNFNSMAVIGGLVVTPKQLAYVDLGISGVAKLYDGSVNMNNLAITATGGFIAGDGINATAVGSFASKNVGNSIPYNIGVLLNGIDKANYQIAVDPTTNNGLYAGNNGVITQLNSVTYTGPNSGGNWSNPANWTTTGTTAVGAIPDLSNVANVIIPVGRSVVYDNAVAGPVTSAVLNSGNVHFNLSSATSISMVISGSGSLSISNVGTITLSGINNYVGGTFLNAGSSLIVGNGSAIGVPNITSYGTAINPASFSTLSAVTLPFLTISGGTTQLLSNITTTGAQTYSALILGSTLSGITTLRTSNANINFLGKIDGATAKSQSLVANAGSGVVTIGDSVGSIARLNAITMTGSNINILADVLSAEGQAYNGNVFIGDAAYIGRTPTVGFLFSGYSSYFQYSTPAITSTLKYLNMNPIFVRTLISQDPNVTFNGTVNDLVSNTHTLLIAAITPDNSAGSSAAASVNFGSSVGNVSPLYSLNAQVVVNQNQVNSVSNYVGTVSLVGNVATYSDQTYRANTMTAQAATQPGAVTFSVYDPSASISYLLPIQASGTGAGQMNLQNPNSLDTLSINGANNYNSVQNQNGTNNWGAPATISNALNYIAPVYVPPAYVPPAYVPPAYVPTAYVPPAYVPPIFIAPNTPQPYFVPPTYFDPFIPANVPANPGPFIPANVPANPGPFIPANVPANLGPAVSNILPPRPSSDLSNSNNSISQAVQNYGNAIMSSANTQRANSNVQVVMAERTVVLAGGTSSLPLTAANLSGIITTSAPPNTTVQAYASNAAVPAPPAGFVHVQIQVIENGVPTTVVTTTPANGFNFKVPDALIARPTETGTVSTPGSGTVVTAVMADGAPIPGWLKFNPETKTFSADKAPDGVQSMQVKVQTMQGDTVIGETTLTLNTK